jgi:hypothetical protein
MPPQPPPPPMPPHGWQGPPPGADRCGRCGYPITMHSCPGATRPGMPGGLVAVLTVAAIVLVLFLVWRFYIDIHCTTVLGTQVCER